MEVLTGRRFEKQKGIEVHACQWATEYVLCSGAAKEKTP